MTVLIEHINIFFCKLLSDPIYVWSWLNIFNVPFALRVGVKVSAARELQQAASVRRARGCPVPDTAGSNQVQNRPSKLMAPLRKQI